MRMYIGSIHQALVETDSSVGLVLLQLTVRLTRPESPILLSYKATQACVPSLYQAIVTSGVAQVDKTGQNSGELKYIADVSGRAYDPAVRHQT